MASHLKRSCAFTNTTPASPSASAETLLCDGSASVQFLAAGYNGWGRSKEGEEGEKGEEGVREQQG
jgi:hypothetical protein